jgi:prevent-host-death family protein
LRCAIVAQAEDFEFSLTLNQFDQALLTNLTKSPKTWRMSNRSTVMAANSIPKPAKKSSKTVQVNLYEAKTRLSSLVERVARGEEIVIAKAGKPMARLVSPVAAPKRNRKPGRNLMGITFIAPDFDALLPEDVLKDFGL